MNMFRFFCYCWPLASFAATTITVNQIMDTAQTTGGTYTSNIDTDLRGALNQINQNPAGNPYTINFSSAIAASSTINLGSMLPLLNFPGFTNSDTTIDGTLTGGTQITINGQSLWRGFFIANGTNGGGKGQVVLKNMVIQNVTSVGGQGGGGGMGAGAGVFVDSADVTLSNVQINTATVTGGTGGANFFPVGGGGLGIGSTGSSATQGDRSGAGGLGGTGGPGDPASANRGGGGGGGINCGAGHTGDGGAAASGVGQPGGAIGAVGAGAGGNIGSGGGGPGGASGGGGGGSKSMNTGGGGGGGIGGALADLNGGMGGYGGGGGTSNNTGLGGVGGMGGFGGGGGAAVNNVAIGATGGFGGGGGTQNNSNPGNRGGIGGFGGGGGVNNGAGGVGGGRACINFVAPYGSGGGAGLGGAIFIRDGSLTIEDSFSTNGANNATGGAGGSGAGTGTGFAGWGTGKDCFFMSGTTIGIDPKGSLNTITMTNSIADDSPSSFIGAAAVQVTPGVGVGAAIAIGSSGMGGTVLFSGANTYAGGTTITSGTLQAGNNTALGAAGATVQNNASLQLLNGVTITQPLGISGSGVGGTGALTKASGATSTYSSLITLNAPATIGAVGSGTLTLTGGIAINGQTLTLTGGGTIAVTTAAISGASSSNVVVDGVAATLSVANTYVGPTSIINGGSVNVNTMDALPTSTVLAMDSTGSGSSQLTLTASQTILSLAGSATSTVNLNGNVLTVGTTSGMPTFDGAISGLGGSLVKNGASTQILTGTNSYTGGTTVSGGVLQGNTASLQGNITNNAAVVFDQAGNGTHTGNISGSGSLTKDNGGTLILAGLNSYIGGTTVSGGVLQGNTASLQGNITNNAAVVFDQAGNGTHTGNISGSGSLTKDNGGTLILAGLNSYIGGTTVSGGVLQGNTASLQGNITNNAAVVFDQAGNGTHTGNISGSGSLTKDNGGTLILAGLNSYIGGTTVSGGVLQGNTASLQGNITNNAAVVFDQAGNGTHTGNISGSGSLTKDNVGTLILTGTNSYGGGTTVSGGVLQGNTTTLIGSITDNASLIFDQAGNGTHTGNISGSGSLTKDNGGTLILAGTYTYGGGTIVSGGILQGNIGTLLGNITNNAAVVFDQAANGIYAGNMSGSGSLTKNNVGTLVLTGVNTYGGGTTVNGGILQGEAASLPGNITNNASVVFDQVTNSTYAGNIDGTGHLVKNNGGTLVLTGLNSYIGGTTVNGGILQGEVASIPGNITNNASVIFDQATNSTYVGNIVGTGSLIKENVGTLSLTGTSNFSGTTDIIGGKLAINGPLTSGLVTIGPSGTLSGNSFLTADVVNQGTVSPGNSVGTLSILGNYIQASGSTLLIEVSPTAADLLSISGTATIQPDATMAIFTSPGTFPATNSYTVLSSTGLTGTFTNTPNNLPTVQFVVRYDANNVYLDIGVSGFVTVTSGGNVGQVSDYIDSLSPASGSDLAFVIGVLRLLDVSQLDLALSQLQPSPYKNLILAQEENVFTVSRGISDHLNDFFNTRCRREIDTKKRWQAWGTGFGDWSKLDNRSNKFGPANTYLGYRATSEGGLVGADYSFAKGCVLGLTGGYSYTDVDVNESRARGHINSAYGAVYGMIYGSNLFLDASFIGGYDWFHASRKIQFGVTNGPSVDRRPYTDHDGWSMNGHVDGGYIIDHPKALDIRPFFALDCVFIHENAFQETGADSLNLSVRESNNTLLRSEAGINLSRCFRTNHGKWIPEVRGSAVWENFSSGSASYQSNFVGEPGSFAVTNRNPNRTLFSPGVGLTGVFREDRVLLSLDYNGEFGEDYRNQVGKAELSWMF